jgi:anaerobic selenocysteine-containing dehydrogenase
VAAASFVLAGTVGCLSQPAEEIVPAVSGDSSFTPTQAEYFATTLAGGADTLGVLVKNQMGRPIKIEGNPDHPASRGATDVHTQAEILTLYDPARSQAVYHASDIATWQQFADALEDRVDALAPKQGAGLCFLTSPLYSPTVVAQLSRVLKKCPKARWFQHDPLRNANVAEGVKRAFGQPATPVYRLANADVIVALGADLLGPEPGHVQHTREFTKRRVPGGDHEVNRLYVAEACPTVTGSKADYRLPMRTGEIQQLAAELAKQLGVNTNASQPATDLSPAARKWVEAAASDLHNHRGKALVVAGRAQPPAVHVLAWAINGRLSALGKTVEVINPQEMPTAESLPALADAIDAGNVDTLLLVDTNPLYDASPDLDLAARLGKVPFSAHLGQYRDETAQRCTWHLPMAHALESWGDACSHGGTFSLVQPLIRPLYGGKSALELLGIVAGDDPDALALVRKHWSAIVKADDFESWWRQALQKGIISDHRLERKNLALQPAKDATAAPAPASLSAGKFEIRVVADHALLDGRYAFNAWMQEVPDPITKLCWGNAALISPATAKRIGVESGQVVELHRGKRVVKAPVYIVPGHADDCITAPLGYGRRMPDSVAAMSL